MTLDPESAAYLDRELGDLKAKIKAFREAADSMRHDAYIHLGSYPVVGYDKSVERLKQADVFHAEARRLEMEAMVIYTSLRPS